MRAFMLLRRGVWQAVLKSAFICALAALAPGCAIRIDENEGRDKKAVPPQVDAFVEVIKQLADKHRAAGDDGVRSISYTASAGLSQYAVFYYGQLGGVGNDRPCVTYSICASPVFEHPPEFGSIVEVLSRESGCPETWAYLLQWDDSLRAWNIKTRRSLMRNGERCSEDGQSAREGETEKKADRPPKRWQWKDGRWQSGEDGADR